MNFHFLKFSVLLFLLVLTYEIINIRQLPKITIQQIRQDPYIQVEISSFHKNKPIQTEYYISKVEDISKRSGILKINQIQSRVIRILNKLSILQKASDLAKINIRPQFISTSRKWSFSLIFAIYGTPQIIQKCTKAMSRIGVYLLNKHSYKKILGEKIQAIRVFNQAQQQLKIMLKRFKDFKINEVEKIQINDYSIQNSDVLQQHLEDEFSDSQEQLQPQMIFQEDYTSASNQGRSLLNMKILFKVGVIQDQDNDSDSYFQVIDDGDDYQSQDSDNGLIESSQSSQQ